MGSRTSSYTSSNSVFASKLICGDCGAFYGRKVWHSTDKYRRTIWRCNAKFDGNRCMTPTLDEVIIKYAFFQACNILFKDRTQIIEDCKTLIEIVSDTSELDKKSDQPKNNFQKSLHRLVSM